MTHTRSQSDRHTDVLVIARGRFDWSLGLGEVWQYRSYLLHLLMREIRGRYRPTSFGQLWLFIRPVSEMLVYALVFGVLFGIRTAEMPYPLFLYSGIILWIFLMSSVVRAGSSLAASRGLMDKIYFPRMIVPLVHVSANALDFCMAALVIGLLVIYYAVAGPIVFGTAPFVPRPGWAILLLPAFVALLLAFVVAISLLIAVWQVYSSDVALALPVVLRLMMYLSPVVYGIDRIPAQFRPYYEMNPISVMLHGFRWSLLGGTPPPLPQTLFAVALTVILLVMALLTFRRVERTMVDVL